MQATSKPLNLLLHRNWKREYNGCLRLQREREVSKERPEGCGSETANLALQIWQLPQKKTSIRSMVQNDSCMQYMKDTHQERNERT